ncbi:MAG TPA: SDR family oxidoreductase, partial [Polyangiaceae bacterium]
MASGCIVVTGGGGALGSAVVRELVHRGYEVAIVDSPKAEAHAKEIAAALGDKAFAFGFDVTSSEAWTTAITAIEKRGMPIVGAALIAGGWAGGSPLAEENDESVWTRMLESNATTVQRSLRALVPSMIDRKNGSIVVIGSRAVERPWTSANASAYAA